MTTFIKKDNKVVVLLAPEENESVAQNLIDEIKKIIGDTGEIWLTNSINLQNRKYDSSSADIILSGFTNSYVHDDDLLQESIRILKPKGILVIRESINQNTDKDFNELIAKIKLNGFLLKSKEPKIIKGSDAVSTCELVAGKPPYSVSSCVRLASRRPASVWKIGDYQDLIDENNLIDEFDALRPEDASLRVCSTTGKRKACKDCSCGLAEELIGEAGANEQPKSSCGSCYLGDAFRCASCPYVGMPAFKPGEKITLPDTQLTADS